MPEQFFQDCSSEVANFHAWSTSSGQPKTKLNSADKWTPKCFEDLHDLPCIIILSGKERPGDTFPR